jgi:hypothetical protein
VEGVLSDAVGVSVPACEDVVEVSGVGGQFRTASAQGTQVFVDRLGHQGLQGARSAVCEGVGELSGVGASAQGSGEEKAGDLGAVVGVVGDGSLRVGLGAADQLRGLILAGAQLAKDWAAA